MHVNRSRPGPWYIHADVAAVRWPEPAGAKVRSGSSVQVEWLRSTPDGCVPHHPIKAVNVLLAAVTDMHTTDVLKMDLANVLERYLGQCGICERISRTPIPMPYTRCGNPRRRHSSTSLSV